MLLRILKSNNLFSTLLIPSIGILFWMHSFQTSLLFDIQSANGAMPLYNLAYSLLKEQAFWQVFVGFSLVIINSYFVAILGSSFLFPRKRSYLPGILYLITVSSIQSLHTLIPIHFATLFVLISIYFILDTYHRPVEISYTFNASFFMALASLFYLPTLILFPLVWISTFILQKDDNWRLQIMPILGFSMPWLFIWTYSFLNNSTSNLLTNIVNMLWDNHNAYLLDTYFLFLTVVVTIVTILGSLSVISVYYRMKVSSRKYFVIFFWMLGLVITPAICLITIGIEIVAFSTIPVAYFFSHFLLSDQKTIWKDLFTWFYLGTMVFALYFY